MKYCAESDPQAERLLEIMEKFSRVVANWTRDHTHPAPNLSADLSSLYSQMANAQPPQGGHAISIPSLSTPREQETSRMINIPHRESLHPPTMTRLPLAEILLPQPITSVADTQMNGMSPPRTTGPSLPPLIDARPSVSSHSMVDSSESMNGDIEFDFDGLWNNWINHVVPVPTGAPGIAHLSPQFSPSLPSANPTFGAYSIPPQSRITPTGISGNIPLYHATNFG
jgi:hypothetical protein